MDIQMCSGEGCPIRQQCGRFNSVKDLTRQSFFVKPPFVIDNGKFTCDYYMGESSVLLLEQLKSIFKKGKE